MNNVQLIGRITHELEKKHTQAGGTVLRFAIAIDRGKDKDGNDKGTDFINCVAFNKNAESIAKHSGKGCRIAVEGRIQTGSYEKDGRKVYTTDIMVDRKEFIDWANENQAQDLPSGYSAVEDDDLPFEQLII